jgi:hypothetical protein
MPEPVLSRSPGRTTVGFGAAGQRRTVSCARSTALFLPLCESSPMRPPRWRPLRRTRTAESSGGPFAAPGALWQCYAAGQAAEKARPVLGIATVVGEQASAIPQ